MCIPIMQVLVTMFHSCNHRKHNISVLIFYYAYFLLSAMQKLSQRFTLFLSFLIWFIGYQWLTLAFENSWKTWTELQTFKNTIIRYAMNEQIMAAQKQETAWSYICLGIRFDGLFSHASSMYYTITINSQTSFPLWMINEIVLWKWFDYGSNCLFFHVFFD